MKGRDVYKNCKRQRCVISLYTCVCSEVVHVYMFFHVIITNQNTSHVHSQSVGWRLVSITSYQKSTGFYGPSFVSKQCSLCGCTGNSVGVQHDCVAPTFCPLIRALYRLVIIAYGQEHKRATAIMPVEKSCTMTYFNFVLAPKEGPYI